MSGIKVSVKTKAKETLKLSNHLRSYLFEQEYGELSNCTPAQKKTLRDALLVLNSVVRPKYDLEFKDFFIPLQDCIERDSKRPNPIGEEVIRKTYEKYKDILKV